MVKTSTVPDARFRPSRRARSVETTRCGAKCCRRGAVSWRLFAGRLLVKGSRVKSLKALRRHIVRSINAQIAQDSKERGSKGAAGKDHKRTYALTILALPVDEI
jgi:hypothetical protein